MKQHRFPNNRNRVKVVQIIIPNTSEQLILN